MSTYKSISSITGVRSHKFSPSENSWQVYRKLYVLYIESLVNTEALQRQESWATAKMTARCALGYIWDIMGILKIFERPWVRPRQPVPNF